MWYAIITLIKKELQALFSSPQSRRMLIMPVLLQLLVFPFAATLEVKNSTLAIYNQDGGAASIELIQRLSAAEAFPKLIMINSETQLQQVIDRQQALLAIRLPQDFSRQIATGQAAKIQAIIDGRRSNSAQIAFSYAQLILQQFVLEQQPQAVPVQLTVQNLYNPNLEYRWFVLPSLVAIITTIGCLMVTALSLAREREEGTFDQLLVSPLTPAYIMVGKAVPGVLVALLQGSIIALAAVFVYRIPFTGSVWLLYLTMLCYGLSLAGFGLLISAMCANQQQAFLGTFGFMSPAVILSGYMAPVENMPPFLQVVSAMNPLSHAIIAIKGIFLKGYTFSQTWPQLWPLLLIASITLTLAYLIFIRRSGQ
ncbi:ABC transporter permease [Solimicrobium silvestre]|uniref:Transport permease protein n=1 Tax=Solimicrobium silvestre TaxID=2099400 RepID=A0A2S9GSK1_9BURK|nr:ABC transporter permease [Solimicrobium silvestre]PRC90702.1 ABC-type multidrug transport system permease component [Solimicrobium silvestre]